MKLKPVLCAYLMMALPQMAHAQYQMVSPMLYNGPVISYRDHVRAQQSAPQGDRAAAGASKGTHAAAPVDRAAMTYRPDLARRRSNLAQFVARTRAVDPAGASNLEAVFAQGDVIDKIGTELRKQNLRVDNVADAYAAWWITAWLATRSRDDDVSAATLNAVREQAASALGGNSQFAGSGDPAKQEMAESLLIQALLIETAVEQSKGNPSRLREVGQAVNKGAAGMGLNLMTMTLTEKGFVPA